MAITLTSDYTGQYKIPTTCYTELASYITKYERKYLIDLLGASLYNAFIADLDASVPQVPLTQIYIDIFDPFQEDHGICTIDSEGIKKMLIQFIYFEYMRDSGFTQTVSGATKIKSKVGEVITNNAWNLEQSYNEGVDNFNSIAWYICENSEDYPFYNGHRKQFMSKV